MLIGASDPTPRPIRRPDSSSLLQAPPPTLILDMLHTANVSGSRAGAAVRITGLLAMRALQNLGRVIPGVSPAYYGGVTV